MENMTKIGRNDLCPCGSGKKYKKCCINSPKPDSNLINKRDELDVLMEKGWSLLQNNETEKACDTWLKLWDNLKRRFKPEFKDIRQAETVFSGREPIFNWCQDLEMELANAGLDNPTYYQKRIEYCNEICSIFPESDESIIHNMKRAVAESHFALGNIDEGNSCFKKLIEQYPNNIWSYIGWGDMYLWSVKKNYDPDYERAEQIYKMALDMNLDGKNVLIDRLDELEKKRAQDA
jgi:tetratricopeptide (TPR) repeat protein